MSLPDLSETSSSVTMSTLSRQLPAVPGASDVILDDVYWAVSGSSSIDAAPSRSDFSLLGTPPSSSASGPSQMANPTTASSTAIPSSAIPPIPLPSSVDLPPASPDLPQLQQSSIAPLPLLSDSLSPSPSSTSLRSLATVVISSQQPTFSSRRRSESSSSTMRASDVLLEPSVVRAGSISSSSSRVSSSSQRSTVIVTETLRSSSSSTRSAVAKASTSPSPIDLDATYTSSHSSTAAIISSGASSSPSPALSSTSMTTFVTDGKTLTGEAAVGALAAAGLGGPTSSADVENVERKGSKLSSFAIVGIVGGVLVLFILIYVVWYQWRKKKNDQGEKEEDEFDEVKTQGRSSFGHDPFMDRQGETWYRNSEDNPRTMYSQAGYVQDDYTLPNARGQSTYDDLAVENALAEDMRESQAYLQDPFDSRPDQDPFVNPPEQVPRADSYAYNSIYAGYAETESKSRGTTMHELEAKTPATSTLLPWLGQDVPPMPQTSSQGPAPPRPAMARSPTIHGGWEGVIPPFR